MKIEAKLPVAVLFLSTPLAAYADSAPGTGVLYAFAGGFAGGLVGALLACWLCKRRSSSTNQDKPTA